MRGGAKMPRIAARSLAIVCLAAFAAVSPLGARRASPAWTPQPAQSAPPTASQSLSREIPSDPRALYQALNELRVDAGHIYTVHELNLRRDVISMKLAEGKLAFLPPIGGQVTGAVFTGAGHILATPRERGERRSLAQFLGVPILDQNFSRAYFRFTDDTAAELRELLAADEAGAASNPNSNAPRDEAASNSPPNAAGHADFVQSWNSIVGNLNPSQSLRVMFDLLAAQPQPYFYAAVASDSGGIFDVLVDSRRDEQVLLGRTRITNGAALYDVWASFRASSSTNGSGSPAAPFRAFAPLDYRVDTTIADDLTIQGKTSLHFKVLRGGERVVPLELSRNLAVDEVLSPEGRLVVFFQNEELSRREILRRGNDSVMVVLPSAPAAGDEIRLDVSYRGGVISDAGNGVKFVGEHETWYAHLAGSESFVPFDLTFRWPRRFTLVATGDQIESHDEGDTRTGHWVSRQPFEVAGFNLGEYKTGEIGNGRIQVRVYANKQLEEAILARLQRHDSAAEAIPSPLFVPRHLPGQVEVAAPPPPPSPASVLKALGGNMLDSIEFFEKLNGAFPFDHLDVSQIPGAFGQGWPGLVYLSTLAFLPPDVEMRVGINERAQEEARELMGPHEAAHQWWGNVVDTSSYRDIWIAEGMANYLTLLWADVRYPNGHRMETWLERYRHALTTPVAGSADMPDDAGPLTLGPRLRSSKIPDAYDTVIYGKGTWVIHMIHEMLRDPAAKDPDARFRSLLRGILEEYRFRPLSTADFQRAVEKRMTPSMDLEGSRKMEWFFDEWVRATGIPHYKVEFQVKPHGDEFVVSGKLLQSGVEDIFTAPVPLYVARSGGKPALLGIVATAGPETKFHFISRTRPAHLLIDPHLTLLRKAS